MALGRAEGGEVALPLDFLREDERHAVLREGERTAPVQVTRILVEDDDFSEAATRGFAPVTEFACRCLPPDVAKRARISASKASLFANHQGWVSGLNQWSRMVCGFIVLL